MEQTRQLARAKGQLATVLSCPLLMLSIKTEPMSALRSAITIGFSALLLRRLMIALHLAMIYWRSRLVMRHATGHIV